MRLTAYRELTGRLLHGSAAAVAVRAMDALLRLLLAIALARVLGPKSYGIYTYSLVIATTMTIAAQFGVPALLVRETARAGAAGEWAVMKGLWQWGATFICIASAIVAAGCATVIWLVRPRFEFIELLTLLLAIVLVPINALCNIGSAALRGLGKFLRSQLPQSVMRPTLMLVFVALAYLVSTNSLTAADAMTFQIVAGIIACGALLWLVRRDTPRQITRALNPIIEGRAWSRSAWPMFLAAALQVALAYMDVLMVGIFRTADEVGVYRVAVQGAALAALGFQSVSALIAPNFVTLHARGDAAELQRVAVEGARLSLAFALPVVLVFAAFGSVILAHVFGNAYAEGGVVLAVLVLGQLVNAVSGSANTLLVMTGHERDSLIAMTYAASCNFVLDLVLIPSFGIEGAAIAAASTILVWNVVLRRRVRSCLGIGIWAFTRTEKKATHP